jgi:photosystem II stability/assembly factor-like uncharacterized protein
MTAILLVGTENGRVFYREDGGEWAEAGRGLAGKSITSLLAREGVVLAGTTEGIFRCDGLAEGVIDWKPASQGIIYRHIRWLANHPDTSDLEYAGTEPAGIFVSYDGGDSWRPCPEVAQLRQANGWYLPYSPAAGCVRGFAYHRERGYAAVEVGGVLRSDDSGETWRLAEGSTGKPDDEPDASTKHIHPDVHSIVVHPSSPELVFAPTGGGFFRSKDGGKTWHELYDCYCRACWIDPADPEHIILSPADGVDRYGRIEETRDGGKTWKPISEELDTPWIDHMVERFIKASGVLYAMLSNGEVFSSPLGDYRWMNAIPGLPPVSAMATMVE